MQRKTLEFQADQIELVLARHKVPGRVSGGLVSPRWVKFDVLPALGARISKIKGLAEELALALEWDVGRIVVDNFHELELLNRLALERGQVVDILLRISPGVDPHRWPGVDPGHAALGGNCPDQQL